MNNPTMPLTNPETITMSHSVPTQTILAERRRKHPFVAGLLSLMPGLGQVYVGYYRRGFIHVLTVASVISILASESASGAEPLFGMFLAFFWMYNIIDATRVANLYNDAIAGLGPDDLRHELVLMGSRGSIGGGLVIVAASLLFLSHTLFDLPLDWLRDWWPAVPLAFGAYLLWRGMQDRKSKNS